MAKERTITEWALVLIVMAIVPGGWLFGVAVLYDDWKKARAAQAEKGSKT